MRTSLLWIVGFIAVVAALFFAFWHVYVRGMQRNGMVQARRSLERAYAEYERTGTLPASKPRARLSIYTNAVIVSGITHAPVVAFDWSFRGGPLVITTNWTVLYGSTPTVDQWSSTIITGYHFSGVGYDTPALPNFAGPRLSTMALRQGRLPLGFVLNRFPPRAELELFGATLD